MRLAAATVWLQTFVPITISAPYLAEGATSSRSPLLGWSSPELNPTPSRPADASQLRADRVKTLAHSEAQDGAANPSNALAADLRREDRRVLIA